MKKIILLSLSIFAFFSAKVYAQDFTVTADTVYGVVGDDNIYDYITPSTSETIKWRVTATDFPSDWLPHLSICDNYNCYTNGTSLIWPTGTTYTSLTYDADSVGDYHMVVSGLAGDTISNGTHYVTVDLMSGTGFFSKTIVFVYTKNSTAVPNVIRNQDDILVYPNPCRNNINVVFNATTNIKNIAVFNIIGNASSVFHVSGNSANINLENFSSGIYFLRMYDGNGQVVATRKFTIQ